MDVSLIIDEITDVAIIATDSRGIIQFLNQGASQLLGYLPAEIVGIRTPSIFHLHAELEEHCLELCKKHNYSITSSHALLWEAERGMVSRKPWTYVRKDKSLVSVLVSIKPYMTKDGYRNGFLFQATPLVTSYGKGSTSEVSSPGLYAPDNNASLPSCSEENLGRYLNIVYNQRLYWIVRETFYWQTRKSGSWSGSCKNWTCVPAPHLPIICLILNREALSECLKMH
jgi:PAS domain S-box-containing protein